MRLGLIKRGCQRLHLWFLEWWACRACLWIYRLLDWHHWPILLPCEFGICVSPAGIWSWRVQPLALGLVVWADGTDLQRYVPTTFYRAYQAREVAHSSDRFHRLHTFIMLFHNSPRSCLNRFRPCYGEYLRRQDSYTPPKLPLVHWW